MQSFSIIGRAKFQILRSKTANFPFEMDTQTDAFFKRGLGRQPSSKKRTEKDNNKIPQPSTASTKHPRYESTQPQGSTVAKLFVPFSEGLLHRIGTPPGELVPYDRQYSCLRLVDLRGDESGDRYPEIGQACIIAG